MENNNRNRKKPVLTIYSRNMRKVGFGILIFGILLIILGNVLHDVDTGTLYVNTGVMRVFGTICCVVAVIFITFSFTKARSTKNIEIQTVTNAEQSENVSDNKKCPNCGNYIKKDAKYCTNCGTKQIK